ncbi:hypothetical protein [Desulfomicrobium escambiense]|uniref:hypothetical protein n=1 Tax=Desulfomicrobium escambiense TaxID=29503 RepID=UPI0012EBCBBE|nr:hypothetical protein [Desulfomicrobium escambiense]
MRRICVFITVLCLGMTGMALADGGQAAGTKAGRLVLAGERAVGADMTASFDMGGYTPPSGQSVAINVDILESPDGPMPRIIPGYPVTSLVFETPGKYVLNFRLNQICKTSCGGVAARPLMEREETIVIAP